MGGPILVHFLVVGEQALLRSGSMILVGQDLVTSRPGGGSGSLMVIDVKSWLGLGLPVERMRPFGILTSSVV